VNWTPKIIATLAVTVGVLVVAIWLGGFGKSSGLPPSAPGSEFKAAKTNRGAFFRPRSRPRSGNTNDTLEPASVTGTNQITNWEETVDALLRDDDSAPGAKAKQLLELLPRFPEAGQAEAAQHIANLIADEDYPAFGAWFTNTNTALSVQEVVLADLLNRPNALKLPLLLEAARTPQHAKATEAKELLELYLEKDYGGDWDAWQQALDDWLKKNPD
jgi:hypothetical protein